MTSRWASADRRRLAEMMLEGFDDVELAAAFGRSRGAIALQRTRLLKGSPVLARIIEVALRVGVELRRDQDLRPASSDQDLRQASGSTAMELELAVRWLVDEGRAPIRRERDRWVLTRDGWSPPKVELTARGLRVRVE